MRRYLLVDDNRALAENLAEIMRSRGDEVVVCVHPGEALAALESTCFDALATDMRMPAMSGAALVRQARARDPGLPAVVFTAHSDDRDLEAARGEGLLAVLPKPVPVARLLSLLAEARRTIGPVERRP